IQDYSDKGRLPEVKQRIVDMAVNGSGIRDTARVLGISTDTVINELKKETELQVINQAFLAAHSPDQITVEVIKVDEKHELNSDNSEAEIDEMWSYVGCKSNKRWLWHAIDRETRKVLAYVFGERKDRVFLELKRLLEPFGINRFYTDDWGAYERNLDPEQHIIGKRNTQKIERKHLTLRTRIKRLARKTICFSKREQMHDIVIGLFMNRYEFGLAV
ncbi:MAG TPA: IS1 family transposase, partial [Saprospiraceae bacterium]|nr:IS1 family transposase [Saprospiraceae bacterium]